MSSKTVVRFQIGDKIPASATFLFYDQSHGWPLVYEVPDKAEKGPQKASADATGEDIRKIVEHLNKLTGSKYTTKSKATITPIRARLNEGRTLEDFKAVIDKKYLEWGEDPVWSKYLRPETLFGSKFDGYLSQKGHENEDLFGELDNILDKVK